MTAWVAIPCRTADVIRSHPAIKPLSGRSDLGGEYGPPEVYTEWGFEDDTAVMREHRYPDPDGGSDRKPCTHYIATEETP